MNEQLLPTPYESNGNNAEIPHEELLQEENVSLTFLQDHGLLRMFVVEYGGDMDLMRDYLADLVLEEENLAPEYNEFDFDEQPMIQGSGKKRGRPRKEETEIDLSKMDEDIKKDLRDNPDAYFLQQITSQHIYERDEITAFAFEVQKGKSAKLRLQSEEDIGEEERERLESLIQAGSKAYEKIFHSHDRLVLWMSQKYPGLTMWDRIQEGRIGLMKAIEKYDPERGFAFSTYATWWIRQAITRAVRDQDTTIRLPVHMGDALSRLSRIQYLLADELGREPTDSEIIGAMKAWGYSSRQTLNMLTLRRQGVKNPASLDAPVKSLVQKGNYDSVLGDIVSTENAGLITEYQLIENEEQKSLEEILETDLPARTARIIHERFFSGRKVTLEEMGRRYKLTRERVRQIEVAGLKHIAPTLMKRSEQNEDPIAEVATDLEKSRMRLLKKLSEGRLLHLEEIVLGLAPTESKIAYRKMYLNLSDVQIARELKTSEELVTSQYVDTRIFLWEFMHIKSGVRQQLQAEAKVFRDLSISQIRKRYELKGQFLAPQMQNSLELFFGLNGKNAQMNINNTARKLGESPDIVKHYLQSGLEQLEAYSLNNNGS